MLDHLVSTISNLASLIGDRLNLSIGVLLHLLISRARSLPHSYLVQLLVTLSRTTAMIVDALIIFLFLIDDFLLQFGLGPQSLQQRRLSCLIAAHTT